MHKFFCNYNHLTERYELSLNRNNFFNNRTIVQAENTLLPEIKTNIQALYDCIVILKEKEQNEQRLNILDETELMISNLYYSLFASPLELLTNKPTTNDNELNKCKELINKLIKDINIPEYNRLCGLIKNNLDNL